MSEKRLVWLSDSPTLETGYANISKQICNRLVAKGWKIIYLGSNYYGQTLSPPIQIKGGIKLDFELVGQGREAYCKGEITPTIREFRPQVFVTLLDTFMVFPWWAEIDYSPAKPVFYFPTDGGGGLPHQCDHVLRRCPKAVAMSEFGQKQVKDIHGIDTHFIPHAVDTKVFYPADKEAAKARFGLRGKFVVGVVARNQPRKMLDRMLKAFAILAPKIPEAILFLHCDPEDPAAIFDLRVLASRLGIINRMRFTGIKYSKNMDYNQMNDVYNAMDVFFLSTSGEGFGIPIIEAMSAGVPVVATDYTTTEELVTRNNAGVAARLVGTESVSLFDKPSQAHDLAAVNGTITGSWMVERGLIDCAHAADIIEQLYKDPSLRAEFGKNGRRAAIEKYDWELIANKWDEFLTGMIEW